MQGRATVQVEQFDGKVKISFRTGSAGKVNLWLMRMGDDWILDGTLNTQNGTPYLMTLKKRR